MIFILILINLANPWIWKIAGSNPVLFLLLIIATVFLYLSNTNKKFLLFSIPLLIIICLFQWKLTTFQSLILLNNDEQRIRSQRLEFYKPSLHYVRVIFKRLNLKEFLEGDFTTATTRIQRNFFETIDPNVYFFAGHPRERVWANDFEKFPYIFIVPFFIGLYFFILQKNWLPLLVAVFCVVLLSYIGHKNTMGPFILFPFFVGTIAYGVLIIFKKIHD